MPSHRAIGFCRGSSPAGSAVIHASSLAFFDETARAVGLDPMSLLQEFGLPLAALPRPEMRIPVQAVWQLLEAAAERSGQPAFGLLMTEQRRISYLGPASLQILHAATLREALTVLIQHMRFLNPTLVVTWTETPDTVRLSLQYLFSGVARLHQGMEVGVGTLVRFIRLLMGDNWKATRVCFGHKGPDDDTLHRRVLRQVPEFNARFNGVVFPNGDLDRPLTSGDPKLVGFGQRILKVTGMEATPGTAQQVQELIVLLLPQGRCSAKTVAEELGVERKTLYRRLLAEGCAFGDLLEMVRRELVLNYLSQPQFTMAEVADELGFRHLSGFSRWHRQNFGCTAQEARGRLMLTMDSVRSFA